MKKNLLFITIILFITACDKPSGEGGTSKISGNITYFTTSYNAQTNVLDTVFYPKANKDVYIIYSDNENDIFDDKTETDWNGNFHFQYLRKGDYTIYTYVDSIVVNTINYDYPVFKHVVISENNSELILDSFIINK